MLNIPYFTCGYASTYLAYPVAPPMAVSSPSGVWGGAPAEIDFGAF